MEGVYQEQSRSASSVCLNQQIVRNGTPALSGKQSWREVSVLALCAGLLIAVVFGPSLNYGFVNWDDPWYVVNNPLITGWSLENLWGIATEVVTRNYAPVTIFSYLVDHTLWGLWPGGYHLTNLLWHFVNTVLVFVLVRQVSGQTHWAWPTALLFALHPVQIESVVWISARKGLISTAFMLLSLCCWLRLERTHRQEMWGTLFFLIALFSKAVAVVLPGIIFLYDWLVRRKSCAEALGRQFVGFLIALWFTLLTAGAQQTVGGGVRHHYGLGKLEIIGVDSLLLWQYLKMLLFPFERSVMYDPPLQGMLLPMIASVCFWTLVAFGLWMVRRHSPLLVFAFATALATLAPVLNLIPLTTLINDRYLYLPCIPLFAVCVAGMDWLLQSFLAWLPLRKQRVGLRYFVVLLPSTDWKANGRLSLPGICRWGVLATAIVSCGVITSRQLPMWRNDLALWNQTVQVAPQLPIVQYQRALALWNAGYRQEALDRLEFALQLPRLDEFDRDRFEGKRQEFLQ